MRLLIQQQQIWVPTTPPPRDPWEFWSPRQISLILGSPMSNIVVQWPEVVRALDWYGIADRPVQIAALATIGVEAGAFVPVREAYFLGEPEPAETWRRLNLWYWPWYGRGLIQLTHKGNYETYGRYASALLGRTVDLVARREDALLTDVSAAVFGSYFYYHRYQSGYGIPDAARVGDWESTRVLVNGGYNGWTEYRHFVGELSKN